MHQYLSGMQYTGCRPLAEWEHEALIANVGGKYPLRDAALIEFGIRTGFRLSEILSLRVGDVFRNGRILDVVTVKRCWMKGRRASRTMPVHSKAAARLHDWLSAAGYTAEGMDNQPIFSRQKTPIPMSRVQGWNIIKNAAQAAGLDVSRLASHSLRKTFATNMWHSNFVAKDMAKMARLLGHQSYNSTLKYIEFLDDTLEQAVLAA